MSIINCGNPRHRMESKVLTIRKTTVITKGMDDALSLLKHETKVNSSEHIRRAIAQYLTESKFR
jgi:hypothetical protein